MKKDLVCDRPVDERATPYRVAFRGKTYHFCSDVCEHEFTQDPRRYFETREQLDFEPPVYGAGGIPPKKQSTGDGPLR